jgi:hypothetical protein
VADIDDPIFPSLTTTNQDPSLGEIEILQSQMSDLFHPQPTAQHQHEDGVISQASYHLKESHHFFVF